MLVSTGDIAAAILTSRRHLVEGLARGAPRKAEAEGGCGVIGFASALPIEAKYLLVPLRQMKNRGNGKGGGIAAAGLRPEQLGVSPDVLQSDFLLAVATLDPNVCAELEDNFIRSVFDVHHERALEPIRNFSSLGLEVPPPAVHLYFVRPQVGILRKFRDSNDLAALSPTELEEEFVYQNSFRLNRTYYASLGEKKAFVLSHGKNLLVLKLVGYGEQVIQAYGVEDLRAHVWIGHHRYPTKGKVWHPGGAHPFVGMNEALVHNGDFANYSSICEYLRQRNIVPLFLTDTEVSVLLFDLLRRTYRYPLEYVFEALAPTTERDFDLLPAEKKPLYKRLQQAHVHGSPDGPWFFILASSQPAERSVELIGITDTSMLRPQVFALQEGPPAFGLVASERQAIDGCLGALYENGKAAARVADLYWNARGGSHTDGGAFVFRVAPNPASRRAGGAASDQQAGFARLVCMDKFGRPVRVGSPAYRAGSPGRLGKVPPTARRSPLPDDSAENPEVLFRRIAAQIPAEPPEYLGSVLEPLLDYAEKDGVSHERLISLLTLLVDRRYPTGPLRRSELLTYVGERLEKVFGEIPLACPEPSRRTGRASGRYVRIDWENRSRLRAPGTLGAVVVDARDFPAEGPESLARFVARAAVLGWKHIVCFGLSGQRFVGAGLGPEAAGARIEVYGSSGDYLGSGLDGTQMFVHGSVQDQVGNILKSGTLVIHGDVGQAFLYAAKGGEIFVLGNAAGRPLINAVGTVRAVINGTALDYLAESFMAGDPLAGGGFVILNALRFDETAGRWLEREDPYPGGNLFSLASGGAVYVRDPRERVGPEQLNGGRIVLLSAEDWRVIAPYLVENERLFGICIEELLTVDGQKKPPAAVFRKIEPLPGQRH